MGTRPPARDRAAPTPTPDAAAPRRRLAARWGLSLRQAERLARLGADPLGRWLLRHLAPRTAERVLGAALDGRLPAEALLRPRPTALRVLAHWRAGQLPGAAPPLARRPPRPGRPPEAWMLEPRLLRAYCLLAARTCPALGTDLRRLRLALRRTLANWRRWSARTARPGPAPGATEARTEPPGPRAR